MVRRIILTLVCLLGARLSAAELGGRVGDLSGYRLDPLLASAPAESVERLLSQTRGPALFYFFTLDATPAVREVLRDDLAALAAARGIAVFPVYVTADPDRARLELLAAEADGWFDTCDGWLDLRPQLACEPGASSDGLLRRLVTLPGEPGRLVQPWEYPAVAYLDAGRRLRAAHLGERQGWSVAGLLQTAAQGAVAVQTDQPGALLTAGGVVLGPADRTYWLPVGRHRLALSGGGATRDVLVQPFTVQAVGLRRGTTRALTDLAHELLVRTRLGEVMVSLDGRRLPVDTAAGQSSVLLDLAGGRYRLVLDLQELAPGRYVSASASAVRRVVVD